MVHAEIIVIVRTNNLIREDNFNLLYIKYRMEKNSSKDSAMLPIASVGGMGHKL